jgi:hypothetical protein
MGVTLLYAECTSDASFVFDNRTTQTFAVRDFNFTSLIEAVSTCGGVRDRPHRPPVHRGIGRQQPHSSTGERTMATRKKTGRKSASKKAGRKSTRKKGGAKKAARKRR